MQLLRQTALDSEQGDFKVWASKRFDSEYRHGMDKDSDLRVLVNVVANDVEVKKRVTSVTAGVLNINTDAGFIAQSVTRVSGNRYAWVTQNGELWHTAFLDYCRKQSHCSME